MKRPIRRKQNGTPRFRFLLPLAGFLLLTAGCMADRFIFRPPVHGLTPPADMVVLPVAPQCRITALYQPVPNSVYTILYSHGNSETLNFCRPVLDDFNRHGYSVIAYDYEGYAASDGQPSETGCYRDVEAIYRWLTETRKIPARRIVIYGRSVGGGPSCYLAARHPEAGALVLECTFTSTFRVVLPFTLPGDRFPNLDYIRENRLPLLIFHGDADRLIDFSHGEKLAAEATADYKIFVPICGAGHNNLKKVADQRYWQALNGFLGSLPSATR